MIRKRRRQQKTRGGGVAGRDSQSTVGKRGQVRREEKEYEQTWGRA